ncbi:DUF2793 domain-containing protein [Rhizobium sp. 0TCS1.26]|uniref:DUF2793 domain-containing protein n=1 Tax=Rhizobium sp. 0TCS1.26 TaxID=3142623 RepID=UPI003D278220
MADTTPNLALPYILPSQAQKHVTHNEALLLLDRLVQLVVEYEGAAPPSLPQEGQRFSVAGSPSGAWAGRAGSIAIWQDASWLFAVPHTGYLAWFKDAAAIKVFAGGTWQRPALPDILTPQRLGIGATPDDTNRLALSSPATLLNNAGAGHQLKINKAASGDTASVLFQSGWSGRAEMGLAGNDLFSVKVSGDGGSWSTGLSLDGAGRPSFPNRPAARAHRASGSWTPASGSETGFATLAFEQGGVSLGATLAGTGQALSIPVDGFYFVSLMVSATASSGHATDLRRNGSTTLMTLSAPAAAPLTISGCGLYQLNGGDSLSLLHTGTATIDEGAGRTELAIARL